MQNINYSDLNVFSDLFKDFVDGKQDILNRFNNWNSSSEAAKYLNKKSSSYLQRDTLYELLSDCNDFDNKTPAQTANLALALKQNTLCIVTGQQSGFLGGPLYGIYKAISAIALASKMNGIYRNYNFIPVFWIEDNDHDINEASKVSLYNSSYNNSEFTLEFDTNSRLITEKQFISISIEEQIALISELLPETEYKEEAINLIKNSYRPGNSLTQAFVRFMQELTGGLGLLFVSASKIREKRMFAEIVLKEITNPEQSFNLLEKSTKSIINQGYKPQAAVSLINLFYHEDDERHKIEYLKESKEVKIKGKIFPIEELHKIALANPEKFSPKVLLRPVVQDFVLPTAVYIGGPGEIAYLAQTKELYEHFDVLMPQIQPRMSAVLLDRKMSRLINKTGNSYEWYLRNFEFIRNEFAENTKDEIISNEFEKAESLLSDLYTNIMSVAEKAEPSLRRTAEANLHKSLDMLKVLGKKTESANRKKSTDLLTKYEELSGFLYPANTLQERKYSVINFINICGKNSLIQKLMDNALTTDKHCMIELFDNE